MFGKLEPLLRPKPFGFDQSDGEQALSRQIGPMDDVVGHAQVPLVLGGFADVAWFRSHSLGLVCATTDMCLSGQRKNVSGNYELAIAAPERDAVAANLISGLGRYSLDAVIEDGHTIDIDGAQPEHSTIASLLFLKFCQLDLPKLPVSVVMAAGLCPSELAVCRAGEMMKLIEKLQQAGVHLQTDWKRGPVL